MTTRAFDIDAAIRKIPDHPHPGILFYDLMPLFQSPGGLTACVDRMAAWSRERQPELVLAPEARGLILGGALAQALGVGVAAARKPAGCPRRPWPRPTSSSTVPTRSSCTRTPSGPGPEGAGARRPARHRGTALALCNLVERLGGVVVGAAFVVELTFLPGRERLKGYDVLSLVSYDSEAA